MTLKSRRATRFRRTVELGGCAPQTPEEGEENLSPKLSTESGQVQPGPAESSLIGSRSDVTEIYSTKGRSWGR
jgi:hypothetical protein